MQAVQGPTLPTLEQMWFVCGMGSYERLQYNNPKDFMERPSSATEETAAGVFWTFIPVQKLVFMNPYFLNGIFCFSLFHP